MNKAVSNIKYSMTFYGGIVFFYNNDISSIYITLECTAVAAAVVHFILDYCCF